MNKPIMKGSDFGDQLALISHEREVRPRRRLRLHDFPMWNNLTDTEVDRLLEIITIRGYRRGEMIFDPTVEPDRLYLLQLGRVKTYIFTPTGRKKMLHIFVPGDAFGALLLGAVDGKLPWAEAMQDVIVYSLDEVNFKSFMLGCPNMCLDLFKYISQIHVEAMRRMQSLLHTRAEQRLAMALLEIGRRLGYGDEDEFVITPYFTHEDIADMIGVVRTTVSELMSDFRRQGIVSRESRKLTVCREAVEQYLLDNP